MPWEAPAKKQGKNLEKNKRRWSLSPEHVLIDIATHGRQRPEQHAAVAAEYRRVPTAGGHADVCADMSVAPTAPVVHIVHMEKYDPAEVAPQRDESIGQKHSEKLMGTEKIEPGRVAPHAVDSRMNAEGPEFVEAEEEQ